MQILSCAHTCDISKLRQNAFYLKYHVAFFFRQILKCCSKRICPKCVAYFPLLVFSSWGSLLTFLCKANFHFHSGSYTWNIQIWLLIAFRQMQQLDLKTNFATRGKKRGGALCLCSGSLWPGGQPLFYASCKQCRALQWHFSFVMDQEYFKSYFCTFLYNFCQRMQRCWMPLCNGTVE